MYLPKVLRILVKIAFTIILFPLKYLVKKGNIVVLSGPNSYSYCDNCRYLYEYLSTDKSLKVYWYTDNEDIKKYLKSINNLYISKSSALELISVLLRTKVMINSGDSYINLFGIIDNPFTYKISTSHGSGPKMEAEVMSTKLLKKLHRFDFLNYPSEYTKTKLGKEHYKLPEKKIISLGYPRCDEYYNPEIIKKTQKEKIVLKSILRDEFNTDMKFIYYTPTWRKDAYNLPLLDMQSFEYNKFNNWLENKNLCFLFTTHFIRMMPHGINNSFKRIKMINRNDYPLFDTNKLMIEIDILLNDYSTTSVDYSILNKPQLFFFPDADAYSEAYKLEVSGVNTRFIDNYRKIIPGYEVTNYNNFTDQLDYIINNKEEYLSKYSALSDSLLEKYLYKEPKDSGKNFRNFIQSLIN